jgi:signal transduction histidine kinase/CHASE3 domain sensor protein
MQFYLKRKIFLGLLGSILIIVSLGFACFLFIQNVLKASQRGAQSQLLIQSSEQVRSLYLSLEVARLEQPRTGNNTIHSNEGLIQIIQKRVQNLDTLSSQRPEQKHRIKLLRAAIQKNETAWMNKKQNPEKGLAESMGTDDTLHHHQLMIQVGQIIDDIQAAENTMRREHAASVTRQFYQFMFSFLGLLAVGVAILVTLIFVLNANTKARGKAEEKLKHALTSIQELYDHAPCGYFSLDKEGMFAEINQTLLGWLAYSKEMVVHHLHVTDVFSREVAILDGHDSEFKRNGLVQDLESSAFRKDKTTLPVTINAVALTDGRGHYLGSRCTLFDNTGRKIAEDKVNRLTKELEAFTYSVSHDLRAPLRSINGYSQILREDHAEKLDDEGLRALNTIIRNANRMGQLIDDLLNFSHTNRKGISKSSIDMTEFVKNIFRELTENEKDRQIQIQVSDLGIAVVDHNLFRQVWINLISNALKYSRRREVTKINIAAAQGTDESIFSIQDNGAGFDMKYYNTLFGVFNRLHKQTDFEGTGVGLALVKRIIERHNGRIWAEAKEDEGATFFFSIPHVELN